MAEILADEDTEVSHDRPKKGTLKKKRLDGTVHKVVAEGDKSRAALADEVNKRLPDKGHYRNEVLKLRNDRLQARIEKMAQEIVGGQSVGNLADFLGLDREIVQKFDPDGGFKITNGRYDMVYAWISYDYPTNAKGAAVRRQLTKRGWEVVNSFKCTESCKRAEIATCEHNMPEAPDLRQPDDTRKLGDTILMRCDKLTFTLENAKNLAARIQRLQGTRARAAQNLPGRVHEGQDDEVVATTHRQISGSPTGDQEEVIAEGVA